MRAEKLDSNSKGNLKGNDYMTEDQRAARLLQMRQSEQQRISSETEDQRAALGGYFKLYCQINIAIAS